MATDKEHKLSVLDMISNALKDIDMKKLKPDVTIIKKEKKVIPEYLSEPDEEGEYTDPDYMPTMEDEMNMKKHFMRKPESEKHKNWEKTPVDKELDSIVGEDNPLEEALDAKLMKAKSLWDTGYDDSVGIRIDDESPEGDDIDENSSFIARLKAAKKNKK